jgi:hypothetical protein
MTIIIITKTILLFSKKRVGVQQEHRVLPVN